MQEREFDNLMDGKAAKFAQMFDNQPNQSGLLAALFQAKKEGATSEEIDTARAEIQKQEVEIPTDIRTKIDKFILDQRNKGTKERTIRRLVQKKFNITVV